MSSLQHKSNLSLHQTERRNARLDAVNALSILSVNAAKAMKFISKQLNNRESVRLAAEGLKPCDIGEIERIDEYLKAIPIHTLPDALITNTMIVGSTVRQFKEKVSMTLQLQHKMDAEMFNDFFRTIADMSASIDETCEEIAAVAWSLQESNST